MDKGGHKEFYRIKYDEPIEPEDEMMEDEEFQEMEVSRQHEELIETAALLITKKQNFFAGF